MAVPWAPHESPIVTNLYMEEVEDTEVLQINNTKP